MLKITGGLKKQLTIAVESELLKADSLNS